MSAPSNIRDILNTLAVITLAATVILLTAGTGGSWLLVALPALAIAISVGLLVTHVRNLRRQRSEVSE